MKFVHLIERRYCPLHLELLQPDAERCVKCGMSLLVDQTFSGAIRQLVQQPAMLYVMLAAMCALILALAVLAH